MRPWLLLVISLGCSPTAEPLEPTAPDPQPAPASPEAVYEVETLASGARRLRISDPAQFWRSRGFVDLAPPVRLAVSARSRPQVTIRLRLPDSPAVTAEVLEASQHPTIRFPPGAEADRVTMVRHAGGFTIADVRGSRIDDLGREWFHVYRPSGRLPDAPLVGYEWLREDPSQRNEATGLLVEHVRRTPRLISGRRASADYVSFFSRMNGCEGCHFANKAPGEDPRDSSPLWPTDQIGWYVPLAVMLPQLALSTMPEWHDPNAADPFVTRRCASGVAREERSAYGRWFSCADGTVPYGVRDIARGLLEGDAYTEAVCRSRRFIFQHMDAAARITFAEAMSACDVAPTSSTRR